MELSACAAPLAFSGVTSISRLKQDGGEVDAPGRFPGGNSQVAIMEDLAENPSRIVASAAACSENSCCASPISHTFQTVNAWDIQHRL